MYRAPLLALVLALVACRGGAGPIDDTDADVDVALDAGTDADTDADAEPLDSCLDARARSERCGGAGGDGAAWCRAYVEPVSDLDGCLEALDDYFACEALVPCGDDVIAACSAEYDAAAQLGCL